MTHPYQRESKTELFGLLIICAVVAGFACGLEMERWITPSQSSTVAKTEKRISGTSTSTVTKTKPGKTFQRRLSPIANARSYMASANPGDRSLSWTSLSPYRGTGNLMILMLMDALRGHVG